MFLLQEERSEALTKLAEGFDSNMQVPVGFFFQSILDFSLIVYSQDMVSNFSYDQFAHTKLGRNAVDPTAKFSQIVEEFDSAAESENAAKMTSKKKVGFQ